MKKLGELISRIILGSSLLFTPVKAAIAQPNGSLGKSSEDKAIKDANSKEGRSEFKPKLVLKRANISEDGMTIAGHSSHSSHSSHVSHASHASHYSGSGGSYVNPSPPVAKKVEPQTPRKEDESGSSNEVVASPRVLIKGMKGNDVFELESLLVQKGYKITPDSLFDEYVELVVKDFQAKAGIQADGKVGPLTIFHLKK